MPNTNYGSVDDYIAAQPEASRPVLEKVREAIRKALPGSEEVISYQIAAFKLDGRIVLFFAGWKDHYSLYPVNDRLLAKLKIDASRYEVNTKGTLRFPLTARVPVRLIGQIAKLRAQENAERASELKSKKAAKKKKAAR